MKSRVCFKMLYEREEEEEKEGGRERKRGEKGRKREREIKQVQQYNNYRVWGPDTWAYSTLFTAFICFVTP